MKKQWLATMLKIIAADEKENNTIKLQLEQCWDYATKVTARNYGPQEIISMAGGSVVASIVVSMVGAVLPASAPLIAIVRHGLVPVAAATGAVWFADKANNFVAKGYDDIDEDEKTITETSSAAAPPPKIPTISNLFPFLRQLRYNLEHAASPHLKRQILDQYCDFIKIENSRTKITFTGASITTCAASFLFRNIPLSAQLAPLAGIIVGMGGVVGAYVTGILYDVCLHPKPPTLQHYKTA